MEGGLLDSHDWLFLQLNHLHLYDNVFSLVVQPIFIIAIHFGWDCFFYCVVFCFFGHMEAQKSKFRTPLHLAL